MQKQINRLLRQQRRFVKIYVNNIIVFFKTRKKHKLYLQQMFEILIENNIFIKFIKVFIDYLSILLLNQKIDFFDLAIVEKKLKTITKFRFSRIFR